MTFHRVRCLPFREHKTDSNFAELPDQTALCLFPILCVQLFYALLPMILYFSGQPVDTCIEVESKNPETFHVQFMMIC